jgi:hypothetical protein
LVLRLATGAAKLPGLGEIGSAAGHGDSEPAIFLPPPCHPFKQGTSPVCSPTGEAVKNV